MKYAVRYFSKSGNTKKIAEAIANAIQVDAQTVDTMLNEPVDFLFLGGGIYAGKMDKKLASFINELTPKVVQKVVVFTTAAGPKSLTEQIKDTLEPKGITVVDDAFQCRGKFLLANRNHPDNKDIKDAMDFAKRIITQERSSK